MTMILTIVDHASNHVPDDIDLGLAPELMTEHMAWDIGAAALADALGYPSIKAEVSRLVIDLNREADAHGLVPLTSDGHVIPGNQPEVRDERIARFHAPYHRALAGVIRETRPTLLASIHSFTPWLEQSGAHRPWEIGILSNRDRRAANLAVALLQAAGLPTGDNEPYSGRVLNATLNRHGEATGIPSIAIEVRNDLIGDDGGVERWADILAPILETIRNSLARDAPLAT